MRFFSFIIITLALVSCTIVKTADPQPMAAGWTARSTAATALPKARIYKVAAEWADLVPVTVTDGRLISYPAPTDVTASTSPVALADGWMLDRQGVNPNTTFLKWTRQEYGDMKTAPTPSQIMDNIVAGSRLQELMELPMTTTEAAGDTAAVNRLIREGLPGCKTLITVFRL